MVSTKPTVGLISRDVVFAPLEAERIFDAPLDGHDFEQRMIEQFFDVAADERVQIPELVNFHEVRVIAGDDKVRDRPPETNRRRCSDATSRSSAGESMPCSLQSS